MNLDHELNKITCRFVECERETRTRQRGADNSSAPLFSSPRPRPWRMAGDAQHPHAPALPLRTEGDGRGQAKKAPALHHGLRPAQGWRWKAGRPCPIIVAQVFELVKPPFWGLSAHMPQAGRPGKGGLWPPGLTLAGLA